MPHTELILVRHGATDVNLRRPYVLQGTKLNPTLADIGREQARAVGNALAEFPLAAVYSSPLIRARQTADEIANEKSLTVETIDTLREAEIGEWEGLSWDDVEKRWPKEHRSFLDNSAQSGYLGGENMQQVCDRCVPMIEQLAQEHEGQAIAIVSHNVVIRTALAHWMKIPLQYVRKIPQNNAGFNLVVHENGKLKVRTINSVHHLAGLIPAE